MTLPFARRPARSVGHAVRFAAVAVLSLGVAAPALLVTVAVPAAAQSGARDASAETFVQAEANRALKILAAPGASERQQFRAFVDQVADVPRITHFVLGKYARSITPQQYAEFAPTFRAYANGVYESRLSEYSGQGLKVSGSIARKPGDVVVQSQVTGPKGGQVVQWRVINDNGGWKVVDVNVAGVWLAVTQQQDFVSTLDNNRGDINVLIRQLRQQTAR